MPKHNINDFDRLFRRTIKERAGAAATHRIKLDRVDAKTLRNLTHVTVENKTNAYTKCRLGINNGGNDHYLDELQTIAADELAVSRSDILLGEGDVLFAELTGATENDVLIMTCVGWEASL
jgi:dihydrofolate reductase